MTNKTIITIVIIAAVVVLLILGLMWYAQMKPTPTTSNNNNNNNNNPGTSNPNTTGKTYNVDIGNFKFTPQNLQIKKGDTVIWKNSDSVSHTVTSDTGTELSSETLSTGQSYSHTFTTAGTINYHCTIHPTMKASVEVQ